LKGDEERQRERERLVKWGIDCTVSNELTPNRSSSTHNETKADESKATDYGDCSN
jgi:hypothetical protein